MPAEPAVETTRLHKSYGDVRALGGVDLSVETGSVFGLLGPTFVPVDSMPSWLQPIAEHNPFTTMVDAARALFLGVPAGNEVLPALLWTIAIIVVFAPLSAWRCRRVVAR